MGTQRQRVPKQVPWLAVSILDRRLGASDGGNAVREKAWRGEAWRGDGERAGESALKQRGRGERACELGADFTRLEPPRRS